MKRIVTLLLSAGLLSSALWLSPAADAAATPVMDAHATGWSHMVMKSCISMLRAQSNRTH